MTPRLKRAKLKEVTPGLDNVPEVLAFRHPGPKHTSNQSESLSAVRSRVLRQKVPMHKSAIKQRGPWPVRPVCPGYKT